MEALQRAVISCSVVCYHTHLGVLNRLLESVKQSDLKGLKLTVVDNANETELQAFCTEKQIGYLNSGANLGYGAGHNLVLRQNKGMAEYHLVLNPDVYFDAGLLSTLVKTYKNLEQAAMAIPKVRYPNGQIQYLSKRLPTAMDLIGRRFLSGIFKKWASKQREVYEMRDMNYETDFCTPTVSGCFMFFSDNLLQQTNGFDERFFLYLEDVDFSRRASAYGFNYHLGHLEIYHDYQKSSYKSLKPLWLHISSAVKYFNKYGWIFDRERHRINADYKNKNRELAKQELRKHQGPL